MTMVAAPARATGPEDPARAAGPEEMQALGDAELLTMIHSLPRGSGARDLAGEVLVTRYQPLVRSCALRYRGSAESQEELMQVGYVGLLKAINNFDPAVGTSLASYAQPCVSGEIKRHFRDKRWQVHVKRSLQELRLEIRNATAELTAALGRAPSDPGAGNLGDLLGAEDPGLEHVVDMQAVWTHWADLPDREQELLLMRFYGNMTQSEIGTRLGISQMHVSRLLAEAISYLRDRLSDAAPRPA
jgi:RNA polymerase sigma-B factor